MITAETILARAPTAAMQASDVKVSVYPDKKQCVNKAKGMLRDRLMWETRWKRIRDLQLPYIGEFEDTQDSTNPARRRDEKMLQGVAWQAAQVFSAGIMSGLTPPSRQWFKFAFSNPELNKDVGATKVLDQRQEIMQAVLAGSNFYNSVHSCYLELPFGQAPLAIFPDSKTGVRFQPLTIGTYALEVGGDGTVQRLLRRYRLTLEQIVESFGQDALPWRYKAQFDNNRFDNKKYTVYWLVEPNRDREPGKIGRLNMPYRSMYWMKGSNENEWLYVGGFEEFPVPVARYIVTGMDAYGKGPGWFAEGDVNALQVMKKDQLLGIEMGVKPPVTVTHDVMNYGGVNMYPGGMTKMSDANSAVRPLFQVGLDIDHVSAEITLTKDDIKRAYAADLFLMLDNIDNGQMTAREIIERQQEKLQQLGPVVQRLQDEFLNRILERVYNILDRSGIFPPIPDDVMETLSGQEMRIDYVSPLAQAQKISGLVNIEQAVSFTLQIAQVWKDAAKVIDPLATVEKYMELLGAPAAIRRSEEEVQQMIQAEQEAMQQAQQEQQAMQMAQALPGITQAAKNATEAANDGNPALADWLGMSGA